MASSQPETRNSKHEAVESGIRASRVVGNGVAQEQGVRRLGNLVERAGPRMQIDAAFVMELSQAVMVLADGQGRDVCLRMPKGVGQRAILVRVRFGPAPH